MLRHKHIDRLCAAVLVTAMLTTCGLLGAAATGLTGASAEIGYERRLFDAAQVHAIDIVMDDWEGFLDTCTDEEYAACTVVIDGENCGNVGIRAKGNTSLSSVAAYGNDRYSFKLEFDHYQTGKRYHGLDKLSLNNLIQDKTRLKDYLAYALMNKMGVAAPLCSFVQVNVNGEFWGLYLAVEGVEDSFLARNSLSGGELYKPDSISAGGGRGNGRDFDMDGFDGGQPGMQGGMNGDDVKLKYIDDDPDSYANIFDSAKTDVSDADKARLIASLKALSEGDSTVVDADAMLRYLVVHNFLCNDDSYTGQMVHNYYLYESDGVLSMIPWDYNLAFGGFSMGGSDASSAVNSPIDSPVTSGELSDRPMVAWIFDDEASIQQYHALYGEFLETVVDSGWLAAEIDRLTALLAPCVETDEDAFFSADTFEPAVTELKAFCVLRAESIAGQLDGSIPSTAEGQKADPETLVDASEISLSVMGEFGGGMGNRPDGDFNPNSFHRPDASSDNPDFPQPPSSGEANFPSPPGDHAAPSSSPDGSVDIQPPSNGGAQSPSESILPSAPADGTGGDPSGDTDFPSPSGDHATPSSSPDGDVDIQPPSNDDANFPSPGNGDAAESSSESVPPSTPADETGGDPSGNTDFPSSPSDGDAQQPFGDAGFPPSPPDDGFPAADFSPDGMNPARSEDAQVPGAAYGSGESWLLLAGCGVVLVAALVFAARYHSNR